MNIGDTILNLLDKNDMSQRELAELLQVAPTTLNGYIKNKHEPDCKTLISLASIFHVSIDYLLSFSIPTTPAAKQLLSDFSRLNGKQQEIVTELVAIMLRQNDRK